MVNWQQVSINTDMSDSLCFGCGQDNSIGLKLSFNWDGKTARTKFTPTKLYQGWPGVVHGGIITSILDEAMGHAARFEGLNCLTAKMQIKFRRPALIDELLVITSSITRNRRKAIEARANISLSDGTPVAESTATQFVIETRSGDTNNKEEKSQSNAQK